MPESCFRLNHQNQSLPSVMRISRQAFIAWPDSCGRCRDCSSSHVRVSASRSHAVLWSGSPIQVSRLAPIQLPVCRRCSCCWGGGSLTEVLTRGGTMVGGPAPEPPCSPLTEAGPAPGEEPPPV